MMVVLRKKLRHLLSYLARLLSTAAAAPPRPPFILLDYLTATVGLSPEQASRAARDLSHLSSPAKPDAVLLFLRGAGFPPSALSALVSRYPRFLCSNVSQTLAPKFTALLSLDLPPPDLLLLVSRNPSALRVCDLPSKIAFWRTLFPSTPALLRALKGDFLLTCSLEHRIIPNLSFLRSAGVSDAHIARLISCNPGFIARSPASLCAAFDRARTFGDPLRAPGMFFYLLHAAGNISGKTLDAKIALFKELGWSDEEVQVAIGKTPYLLKLSERKARTLMTFYTQEAGCTPEYLARRPVLLLYDLPGRVVPRYRVLESLKKKRLIKKDLALTNVMAVSEEKFVAKFVVPYGNKVRKIYEMHLARASADRVSS